MQSNQINLEPKIAGDYRTLVNVVYDYLSNFLLCIHLSNQCT